MVDWSLVIETLRVRHMSDSQGFSFISKKNQVRFFQQLPNLPNRNQYCYFLFDRVTKQFNLSL